MPSITPGAVHFLMSGPGYQDVNHNIPPQVRLGVYPSEGGTDTLLRRTNGGEWAALESGVLVYLPDPVIDTDVIPEDTYEYMLLSEGPEEETVESEPTGEIQLYQGGLIGEDEVKQEDIDAIAAKVVADLSALATTDPLSADIVSYSAGLSPAETLDNEMVGGGSIRQAIGTAASMAVGRIRRNPDNQNEWLLYAWNNPNVVIATITPTQDERTSALDESIQPPE